MILKSSSSDSKLTVAVEIQLSTDNENCTVQQQTERTSYLPSRRSTDPADWQTSSYRERVSYTLVHIFSYVSGQRNR